jgi:hypothetical protein
MVVGIVMEDVNSPEGHYHSMVSAIEQIVDLGQWFKKMMDWVK